MSIFLKHYFHHKLYFNFIIVLVLELIIILQGLFLVNTFIFQLLLFKKMVHLEKNIWIFNNSLQEILSVKTDLNISEIDTVDIVGHRK